MTPGWEYVTITYEATARSLGWDLKYSIRRSDCDSPEERSATNSLQLLNELGAEGWELVSETIYRTGLVSGGDLKDVGAATMIVWTLKRPV